MSKIKLRLRLKRIWDAPLAIASVHESNMHQFNDLATQRARIEYIERTPVDHQNRGNIVKVAEAVNKHVGRLDEAIEGLASELEAQRKVLVEMRHG